jgi:hypothetical protein
MTAALRDELFEGAGPRACSVKTHRLLANMAQDGGGNIEAAATGDPKATKKVVSTKPARR